MKWNDPTTHWDGKTFALLFGIWALSNALIALNTCILYCLFGVPW